MSEYSFNLDKKSVTHVITTLSEQKRNLNDWEKDFIDNIKKHYVVKNKWLSDKQKETLSKMWSKY